MSALIYQCFKLSLATLYPAYSSYKAVKTKNVKEYVKWMMYWVVYAFFVSVELIADFFVACCLRVECGSDESVELHSITDNEIDCYIEKASEQGYSTLLALGSRAVTLTTNVILANAIKGQTKLVDHLSKSGNGKYQGNPGDSDVDKQDGGGDHEQKAKESRLQRTDSTISEASCDERENEIIRECFQEVMSDKRPTKTTPLASKELRNFSTVKRK